MDQKHFDMLIKYIEDVACGFRGHTLSEEQFNQVDGLWNDFRNCYVPCYTKNNPVEDTPELKIGDDGLTMEFGESKYVLSTPWDISSATCVVEVDKIRGFVEDDCGYFHFFPDWEISPKSAEAVKSGGWTIEEGECDTYVGIDVCESVKLDLQANKYDDAMKVMK